MLRKASIAVIAFATVGSALFGGAALANGNGNGDGHGNGDGTPPTVTNTGGAGGKGGDIEQKCENESAAYNVIKFSLVKDSATLSPSASAYCAAESSADGGSLGDGATY